MERVYTIKVSFTELLTLDKALFRSLSTLANETQLYAKYPSIITDLSNETAITHHLRDKLADAITE